MDNKFDVFAPAFSGIMVFLFAMHLAASPVTEAQSQIQRTYQEEDVAAERGNVTAAMSHFLPDWFATTPTGQRYTFAMLHDELAGTMALQRSAKSSTKVIGFTLISPRHAQVKVVSDTSQVLVDPSTQALMTITSHGLSLDDLVFRNNLWLHRKSRILSVRVRRNGKVIQQ